MLAVGGDGTFDARCPRFAAPGIGSVEGALSPRVRRDTSNAGFFSRAATTATSELARCRGQVSVGLGRLAAGPERSPQSSAGSTCALPRGVPDVRRNARYGPQADRPHAPPRRRTRTHAALRYPCTSLSATLRPRPGGRTGEVSDVGVGQPAAHGVAAPPHTQERGAYPMCVRVAGWSVAVPAPPLFVACRGCCRPVEEYRQLDWWSDECILSGVFAAGGSVLVRRKRHSAVARSTLPLLPLLLSWRPGPDLPTLARCGSTYDARAIWS